MKLFTAIVALTGMSTATASLRGANGILPSEMKDLLNKLAAADSQPTTTTCVAAANQMCDVEGVRYPCPVNYGCNFINMANKSRHAFADSAGHYCRPSLELDELVEEESEHNDDCDVLGKNDGGCVPHGEPGLHCKEGLSCVGYVEAAEPGASATLGRCTDSSSASATKSAGGSPVAQCNRWVNEGQPCQTTAECTAKAPTGCEVTCQSINRSTDKQCWTRSSSEEEVEEEDSFEEHPEDLPYEDTPADAAHCITTNPAGMGGGCALDEAGKEVLHHGKRCCSVSSDGTYSHEHVTCNFVNNRNAGAGKSYGVADTHAQCVSTTDMEDLAAN